MNPLSLLKRTLARTEALAPTPPKARPSSTEPAPLKCTYCGGTKFYEGPSGGMAVNVLCANDDCRHWFNHSPFGLEDLQKVEPTKDEATTREARERAARDKLHADEMEEGRNLLRDGKSARACLKDQKPYWHTSPLSHGDAARMLGYMDAIAQRVKYLPDPEGPCKHCGSTKHPTSSHDAVTRS